MQLDQLGHVMKQYVNAETTGVNLSIILTNSIKGPFKCYVTQRGVGGGSAFPEKSVTKVYGSTLLALRGGGWGSNFQEKSVT